MTLVSSRREEFIVVAANLFAARGFSNVTVNDVGDAAGVSGPALYHHFAGKEALLGEILVSSSQQLLDGVRRLVAARPPDLLGELIMFHAVFAVDNRSVITVQSRDLINATVADQRRVRRLQSLYATFWVDAVMSRHGGVDKRTARSAVHAVFGLVNSTPFSSTLPRAQMIELLVAMATGALSPWPRLRSAIHISSQETQR
jgi:AcrR family transcriptional regulator